jgi:hypothetical protein
MSVGGSLPARPSEDATAVRYGQREVRPGLIVAASFLAVSAAGLTGAALADNNVASWILGVVFGPPAFIGLVLPIVAVAERDHRFVFDATAWWWFGSEGDTLLTWESLAGACVYSTGDAAVVSRTATLELFPRGDFDRDHPLLWRYVRDGDPPADGLPRLRYRIELTRLADITTDVEQACSRLVPPHLWHGTIWQPKGYKGRPDRTGHRRRLRERAQLPAAPQADSTAPFPLHDAVPPGDPQDEAPSGSPG